MRIPISDDWKPKKTHLDWAFARGRSGTWVDERAAAMRNWAKANGRQYVDWDARFDEWMRQDNERESAKPENRMLGGGFA
jgi:hypothetical protein